MKSPVLERIRSQPSFIALSSLIGLRILAGDSMFAYHILIGIGSTPRIAHNIVEGWLLDPSQQRLRGTGMSLEQEAACRFFFFIKNFDAHDWAKTLGKGVMAAELAASKSRQRDSDDSSS